MYIFLRFNLFYTYFKLNKNDYIFSIHDPLRNLLLYSDRV